MAGAAASHLVRILRRRDLVGILLNAMIGAGMLAAPAKVYALAGDWSFAVLAAAAALLVPLVLCFADLGSRFSSTGGAYLYARAALPPISRLRWAGCCGSARRCRSRRSQICW